VAMALLDGDVTVRQFENDRWRTPEVMALVAKTSVRTSEMLMAKLPKGRGASVEITFANGEPARETVEIAEGDAQRPLSQASLERKFMNFAVPVVGSSAAERMVALVENLDHVADVRQLMSEVKGLGKQASP
jgi:2-methylcitrate dehydratase